MCQEVLTMNGKGLISSKWVGGMMGITSYLLPISHYFLEQIIVSSLLYSDWFQEQSRA